MTKEEAVESIKADLAGLLSYAKGVREDWSDFDGRSLLSRVDNFNSRVSKALSILESEAR